MFPEFTLRFARLPERFYLRFDPVPVPEPRLVAFNRPLAEALGFDLDAFEAQGAAQWLSGNRVPQGAEPLAQAYAGHQFGHFNPRLGDGRAVLLGEVTDRQGRLRDIQLKGAGMTPFSRGADGRAPLGPVLREYLISEAMHRLGVPTTRALAAVTSGERLFRRVPEPGAVLTRVAASHLRVGTFQYFAARDDGEAVRMLADMAIERHYPGLLTAEQGESEGERYLGLLEAVADRQASLVAKWMGLGFVHGVMNTDNCTISGETIDYGPCAFMEAYSPTMVFSSIDEQGRYAYRNQPWIAQWNLARLAETLIPLIDDDQETAVAKATEVIKRYEPHYEAEWLAVMRAKLGLEREEEGDRELVEALLEAMQAGRADFTLTFRRLSEALEQDASALFELFETGDGLAAWLPRWRERLARESADAGAIAARMNGVNPLYIPRNHQVERVIAAAVEHADFGPFEVLGEVLAEPFVEQPGREEYAQPAPSTERVFRTFCGT
ncbi:protein adenylyltransferase SelO [Halomonas icarae]|uniref:Protein nucleotidyltransferase YdiU n=1 Tax=Halomonas icarae TaxID=2691040 RepID=A0A7X4VYM2_9GAMM|nr:YdiU family protein [Halomonas icarae]MDR5901877.1 YdiU family protein [Halomonas icarae]NAW12626.1 YdiU family protein [Halomonas icarae]